MVAISRSVVSVHSHPHKDLLYICVPFYPKGADRTIRIWSNRDRAEIARLSHNSPIIAVDWMEGDIGVISLGQDGLISKWSRSVSTTDSAMNSLYLLLLIGAKSLAVVQAS